MKPVVKIGRRRVGAGEPCYIIAEAGVNHNGSMETARQLVAAAAEAGADAVKFQSYKTKAIVTGSAPKADYQKKNAGAYDTQEQMLAALELTDDEQAGLSRFASMQGIDFLSTPFDLESARMLRALGVNAFKVSSGCLTYRSLLVEIASYGLPVILSTGMATMDEVGAAVGTLRDSGSGDIVLLQCVTDYPADIRSVNLRAMPLLGREFGALYGYSDHTVGDEAVLAAVALGACVIEKHLTLDRSGKGPDHAASMMPGEFKTMVARIRRVEASLGVERKEPAEIELINRGICRYSVVAARPIKAGAVLAECDLTAKRPGTGISPAEMERLIGHRVLEDIAADELLGWHMVEGYA